MKNFNIIELQQVLGEGGGGGGGVIKKTVHKGNCLKRGPWIICRGLCEKAGRGFF